MNDAVYFMSHLSQLFYNALNTPVMPVLGVTFMTALLTVLFIKVCFWAISVLTGGKQDKETGGGLDNNNHYIYRR